MTDVTECEREALFALDRDIFCEAEKHILELMKKNSYSRFIQSDQYRDLLQSAPNPVPKKTYVVAVLSASRR